MLSAAALSLEVARSPDRADAAAPDAIVRFEASADSAPMRTSSVVDTSFVGLGTGLVGLVAISGKRRRRR
jgi:hypothetical protein